MMVLVVVRVRYRETAGVTDVLRSMVRVGVGLWVGVGARGLCVSTG